MESLEFVKKWAASTQSERATAQEHFIDLCRLLSEQTPNEADPSGDFYAFEKGAKRPDSDGFADVWLKNHFAWEYKGKHKDLGIAYKQVQTYREALGNPPLLVVSDIERFEVHTNWTNTETWIYHFRNADIALDEPVEVTTYGGPAADAPRLTALQVLKALFEEPERLKPLRTTEQITQEAAKLFGRITDELRTGKVEDMRIARFVTRVMFCMFATDVGLLPRETFSEVINVNKDDPAAFRKNLSALFKVMRRGGKFFMHPVPFFNGRLFEDSDVPREIHGDHIRVLEDLNSVNWADVEPVIFGTLFERVIDPAQRRQIGAHYTSRADIELIVEPVLMIPLRREWEQIKAAVQDLSDNAGSRRLKPETVRSRIAGALQTFHDRLATIRVLDPACGSGNFLYVSLALLKALEKEVIAFAASYDIPLSARVHPRQLLGIETSEYARELAAIVIWIGYLQWKLRNGIPLANETPILQPLNQIELRDAILDLSDPNQPRIPEWPEADVIVGNPPFLGGGFLRSRLGNDYVEALFRVYGDSLPNFSDLCCYWFEQARSMIADGRARRVGLLATQGIRGGANRRVLERIKETGDIFLAHSDRPWILDGAAVHVSIVGFDDGSEVTRMLDGQKAPRINPNLTGGVDLTKAQRLKDNLSVCFMGPSPKAPFDIPADLARRMVMAPVNPNGRPNSDVVRPVASAIDLVQRPRGFWTIDFPPGTTEKQAAMYEAPFEYVKKHVLPVRLTRRDDYRGQWWQYARPRPEMREMLFGLSRYIATPHYSKHRLFVWVTSDVLCNQGTLVFARDDDYFFGVLHSRVHEVWARATGTQLREAESGFRYTPTTCFETFALPHTSSEGQAAVGAAARELDQFRQKWLNAPEDKRLRKSEKRTLTKLYNERPTWLANAHRELDEAVFAAYGWPEPPDKLSDSEIVSRLLRLNLEREPA